MARDPASAAPVACAGVGSSAKPCGMTTGPSLQVLVDGNPLPPEEARALWLRFSDWMEEHKGDLAGFAAQEGFASVRPAVAAGAPVLVASRSAQQVAYGNAQELRAPAKRRRR